jgi:hypothetical protein
MSEVLALNPPNYADSTKLLPKDHSQDSIWTRLSRAIWGPEKNEQFPETTREEMRQALLESGRNPDDKCLPLVGLYDSEQQAEIDDCRARVRGGELLKNPHSR